MSYRNAAASCQSTVAYPIRQGITRHFLAHSGAFRCNACLFCWHLLTEKMLPCPAWDG